MSWTSKPATINRCARTLIVPRGFDPDDDGPRERVQGRDKTIVVSSGVEDCHPASASNARVDESLVAVFGNVDCYERRLRRRRLPSGHRQTSKVTVGTFTLETCRPCPTRGGGATLAMGFASPPLDRSCIPNVLRPRADLEHHPQLGGPDRRRVALHRARQAAAERLHRTLQRPTARRAAERDAVPVAAARPCGASWRHDHNTERPHSALGHLTPRAFARQAQHAQRISDRRARPRACSNQPKTLVSTG